MNLTRKTKLVTAAVVAVAAAGVAVAIAASPSTEFAAVPAANSNAANTPLRWLAEGRDASATVDADATPLGFGKNDGDNEITGLHVSDGDPTANGILGRKEPHPFNPSGQWRVFYTQQHGDNTTWEVVQP